MTACRRPGCTGQIDDGYCDLCGRPEAPAAAPVTVQGGGSPGPGTGPGTGPPTNGGGLTSGPSGPTGGGGISGPATSGRGSGGEGGMRRGELGAGLAEVPPVPRRDPAEVVLKNPEVPEHKRYCSRCGHPVGRSRGRRPGRTEGFCPQDGTPYSFTPKLGKGDLVAGQYEVLGCLAHGGMGWIYLATDRNLDGREVVLKGLLNNADPGALEAAEAERRFLISVDHANIVKIINFVRHPDPRTGAPSGYLVMEYIGGSSLQELLKARLEETGGTEALPLRVAIPYVLEVLKALAYLHGGGKLYCDLKPANMVHVDQELKLIDLGAMRLVSDTDSDVYGTVGYQAPEISGRGPSVASDLYTVGRTLAVLALPFSPARRGPDGRAVENPLPSPRPDDPDSLHRFLRRATARDPAARFQSADEMAEQLRGVLREVRAAEKNIPYPAQSALFGPERVTAGAAVAAAADRVLAPLVRAAAAAALPVPLVRLDDPAAASLAGLVTRNADELIAVVESLPSTPETRLTLARVKTEDGRADARDALAEVAAALPGDWRVVWYRAVHELISGDLGRARTLFDDCATHLPGECAPKLALGFTLECAGAPADGATWYETVWRTDRGYVSAAFGLARSYLAEGQPGAPGSGDRGSAIAVLDAVPPTSVHHATAQMAIVAAAVRGRTADQLDVNDLTSVGDRLGDLRDLDVRRRLRFEAEVLEAALACLEAGAATGGGTATVLGVPLDRNRVRQELERVYRELAWSAATTPERHALIERANSVRPWTWL